MNLTGIILAGGKSSRMRSDKGLIEFKGKRLIEYSIELLGKYCDELIISSNNPAFSQFGITLAGDEVADKGPLSGISSAMKKSSGEWNIVLGCDMPFVNATLIDLLIGSCDHTNGVVPVHDGYFEPLAAIYHRTMADTFSLSLIQGELSLYHILQTSDLTLLPAGDLLTRFPLLFSNINTPEDLLSFSGNGPSPLIF
jgi:molybdenum cofactor guanylyltransferase